MTTVASRKVAAILGSVCADAACQPLHWVYDQALLDSLLAGKEEVEFFEPSANPFYHIPTGSNSCYGDQAFVLLESLVCCHGLNGKDLAERTYKHFGPESKYDNERTDKYKSKDETEKKRWDGKAIDGPWRNGCIKDFLKNYGAEKVVTGSLDDKQVDGIAKMAPVVALYAGHPDFQEKVEEAMRVTQTNEYTVGLTLVAARILEQFILHGSVKSPVAVVEDILKTLSDTRSPDHDDLDAFLATQLRPVLESIKKDHRDVATNVFKRS